MATSKLGSVSSRGFLGINSTSIEWFYEIWATISWHVFHKWCKCRTQEFSVFFRGRLGWGVIFIIFTDNLDDLEFSSQKGLKLLIFNSHLPIIHLLTITYRSSIFVLEKLTTCLGHQMLWVILPFFKFPLRSGALRVRRHLISACRLSLRGFLMSLLNQVTRGLTVNFLVSNGAWRWMIEARVRM